MKKKFYFLFLLLFLVACGEEKLVREYKVDGFAYYTKQKEEEPEILYKAISPEGVHLRLSKKTNYPENATQDFWAQAIRRYVPDKGYRLIKEEKTKKGILFLFLVPGLQYDYFYFMHFFIKEKAFFLTEAGGQYAFFEEYEKRLLEFIDEVERKEGQKP